MRDPASGVLAVIFDLDGVIRRWDPSIMAAAEVGAGLPLGELSRAVLDDRELLLQATTGQLSDTMWRETIAATLSKAHGPAGPKAVRAWSRSAGEVAMPVLQLVRTIRQRTTVALLSNATTRLEEDLARLDLLREFDAVFNTSDLGVAKPAPAVYEKVCEQLGARPGRCAFVDDSRANVEAAEGVGLIAHLYDGVPSLREFLDQL